MHNRELRDTLIHNVYGLVNDASLWRETANTLDALIEAGHANGDTQSLPEEISSLYPHLQRVDLLLTKIKKLRLHDKHNESVLEHIPMGIAMLDEQGNILQTNQMARTLLDHMQSDYQGGKLQFKNKLHQRELIKALRLINHSDTDRGVKALLYSFSNNLEVDYNLLPTESETPLPVK